MPFMKLRMDDGTTIHVNSDHISAIVEGADCFEVQWTDYQGHPRICVLHKGAIEAAPVLHLLRHMLTTTSLTDHIALA